MRTPDFNLPDRCMDMTPKQESTVLGGWIRRTVLNSRRASCSCCHRFVAQAFLLRAPACSGFLMSIWMRVLEGYKPFAQSTTSRTSRPPVYVASSNVCTRRRGGGGVGVGVGGWVGQATLLREVHCKSN